MMDREHDKILLVIDGGGTKTRALIAPLHNPQTPSLAQTEAGPSNFGQVGSEGLTRVLREVMAGVPESLRQVSAVAAGLAGVGRDTERQKAEETLRQVFPNIPLLVRTDAELAYYGAFGLKPNGILVIAGTGSIAWTRLPDGKFLRAGGWGPLLGDEGGGAWLGREALRLCLTEEENRSLGPLSQAILKTVEITKASDILTLVYQQGWGPDKWATLAPLVFRYADRDSSAHELTKRTGIVLAQLAGRLIARIPMPSRPVSIAVVGGLTVHWQLLEPSFGRELAKESRFHFEIVKSLGDALFGGRLLAQEAEFR
ncbi:MAG: BadF/BadG/BcrA/BcrD ATPase family protein [bacterium]